MPSDLRIPAEVAQVLGYYVYALRDPRDGRIFYVGKGRGGRINAHAIEASHDRQSERAKLRTINEVEQAGLDVDLLFLRVGIEDEATAFVVEQSVIDAFLADGHPLTNLVRGHHSGDLGLATLPAVIARLAAKPCPPIPHPVLMFKIQRGWRADMNDAQIYEQTHGHWKVGALARERAVYALGIAYGVVRGAYRVRDWYEDVGWREYGPGRRWGFDGEPAPELAHTIGTHVRDVFPNRLMYRQFIAGYPGGVDMSRANAGGARRPGSPA